MAPQAIQANMLDDALTALGVTVLEKRYPNRTKFNFGGADTGEMMVYLCEQKDTPATSQANAKAAHHYMTTKTEEIGEQFADSLLESEEFSMVDAFKASLKLNSSSEQLAKEIEKKFQCTLLPVVELVSSDNPAIGIVDAASFEDSSHLQEYIDAGIDVNHQDEAGVTALINAAYYNLTENANLLLEQGANIQLKSNDNTTAISAISQMGEPLNHELLNLLLSHGADINQQNSDGDSLLTNTLDFHSEDDDRSEDIILLLNLGAKFDRNDNQGNPLFWNVCRLTQEDAIKTIIDIYTTKGGDIEATNNQGLTVLSYEQCVNNSTATNYLLELGAEQP